MITLICKYCSNPFQVKPYRKDIAVCCSRKCLWHITKSEREPKRLQQIIGKIAHNNRSISFTCLHCGSTFKDSRCRTRKYCSKQCVNKAEKSIWKAKFTTVRKNMLRRGLITKCIKCGFNSHPNILGIHHVDRDRNNNDPSNLEVLCPNCHSIEHDKHIVQGT